MDEPPKTPPSIADLQVRLAVLMERMTNLAVMIDDRFQGMKRMHERVDGMEDQKTTLAKIEVRLMMLEKLVYAALAMGATGLFSMLWTLLQKVMKL